MWLLEELKARKDSNHLAMIYRGKKITYRELWNESEKAAYWITQNSKTKNPVLIYGNKDIEILIVIVAALKTGRAYVPVDITFPVGRLQKIASITEAEILFNFSHIEIPEVMCERDIHIVDTEAFSGLLKNDCRQEIPENLWIGGGDNCYILFTTGSTGEPKGVQINKKNIINFVDWFSKYTELKKGMVALNQVSYSFDVSVIQLYIFLAKGITLFNIDKQMICDFGELFSALRDSEIAVWVSISGNRSPV